MSAERLQKILARGADLARRQAEELIRDGRVEVNGTIATLGDHADPEHDAIRVDGKRFTVVPLVRRTLLINKPSSVMSTRNDPQGRPTVLDLLPVRLRTGMFPVGRLDFDTEGLLIMTNDGEFAQRIAHPRNGCSKTYEARVKGRPDKQKIDRLRRGILLFGKRTQPATIKSRTRPAGPRESVSNSWWTIVLREGRTRQVREMFYRVGHPVGRLRRIAIGPIQTGGLPSGGWRELDETEIARLVDASTPQKKPNAKKPAKPRRSRAPARADTPRTGASKTPGRAVSSSRNAGSKSTNAPAGRPGRSRPTADEGQRRGRPARGGGGGGGGGGGTTRGRRGPAGSGSERRARPDAGSGRGPGSKKGVDRSGRESRSTGVSGRPNASRPNASRPNASRSKTGAPAGRGGPKPSGGPRRGPKPGSTRGPKPGGGKGRRPKSGGRGGTGKPSGGGRGRR